MNLKQHFDMPVTEIIKMRSSVRTYQPQALPSSLSKNLEDYARGLEGPFTPRVRFVFLDDRPLQEKTNRKIGTYGIIKGAMNFIAGVVEQGPYDLEQLGYVMEKLVLYATSLGLGTCWLGGTFRHVDFVKAVELKDSERLLIVSPVGYASEKKRFLASMMKLTSGSRKRKPWPELFFHRSFDSTLGEEEAGLFATPLEMVRRAPSASNRQPWRVVKDHMRWHFFMNYSPLVNKAVGFDIQRVDMGIALCHFGLTAVEQGLAGDWITAEEARHLSKSRSLKYVISWQVL